MFHAYCHKFYNFVHSFLDSVLQKSNKLYKQQSMLSSRNLPASVSDLTYKILERVSANKLLFVFKYFATMRILNILQIKKISLKAHTHTPILARSELESAVELTDCTTESADCTTDSVIVCQLSVLNMFNILKPMESAEGQWRLPSG